MSIVSILGGWVKLMRKRLLWALNTSPVLTLSFLLDEYISFPSVLIGVAFLSSLFSTLNFVSTFLDLRNGTVIGKFTRRFLIGKFCTCQLILSKRYNAAENRHSARGIIEIWLNVHVRAPTLVSGLKCSLHLAKISVAAEIPSHE